VTLPTSKAAVLQKFPASPYKYIGPFDNAEDAAKYIEDKQLLTSYVIELREP